jgi:hypothetical protein
LYWRDNYANTEWADMIKTELNAARPVLYSGSSYSTSHLFVCDGYDNNNLFHINWGWGGSSNGYFELSALDPYFLDIGGGGSGGYNIDQYITIGIQKPTASPVVSYNITADYYDTPANTTRTGSFFVVVECCAE